VYCLSNSDCTRATPFCPTPPQWNFPTQCELCSNNQECWPWPNTHCNATVTNGAPVQNGQCIYCSNNAECAGTTPICDNTGACVGCASNSECYALNSALPVCSNSGSFSGSCVQCQSNSDCTTSTAPICYTNVMRCQACVQNSQCPNTCNADGSCS